MVMPSIDNLIPSLRENGVVGAGGAGFPTYAKLKPPIEYLIINAAECEPLLHKDKELLKRYGAEVLEGMKQVRSFLGAGEAILGIKGKYHDIIDALTPLLEPGMRIHPLGDFYPTGDEFVLIYETIGRVVPPGGLPFQVGALVMNVETVLNLVWNRPVTHKYLTVAGAVNDPQTVRVPIGISLREVIEACGGAAVDPYEVITGGVMMGRYIQNLDDPVTKTTGGILVFPPGHPVIERYRKTPDEINRIGRSACDQCSFCTELCPRYLLGHPIEPHRAMRSLGFSVDRTAHVLGTLFCCECNLCTMIACPEALDPKNVCAMNKAELRSQKAVYPESGLHRPVHSMREGRQTPLSRLIRILGLHIYENKGPYTEMNWNPARLVIPLKQHAGTPATPVVSVGTRVREGDVLARVDETQLGASIHASMDGVVSQITDKAIEIERG